MDTEIGFWAQIAKDLGSGSWWAEQLLTWIMTTVIVGALLKALQFWMDAKYRNWKLQVVGTKEKEPLQHLYIDEVKAFFDSEFELWKFVKSVCSAHGKITISTGQKAFNPSDAIDRWVTVEKQEKLVSVDIAKAIELGHLKNETIRKSKYLP